MKEKPVVEKVILDHGVVAFVTAVSHAGGIPYMIERTMPGGPERPGWVVHIDIGGRTFRYLRSPLRPFRTLRSARAALRRRGFRVVVVTQEKADG